MLMAKKLVEAVKASVKKPAKKEVVCTGCNGRGLLDADNLCVVCDGSGKVTS